jgi:hypothetical protein
LKLPAFEARDKNYRNNDWRKPSKGQRLTKESETAMHLGQRTLGTSVISLVLIAGTGCSTGTGAATGAGLGAGLGALIARRNPLAGALFGAAAGAVAGAIIGHINEEQQAKLQQESPETLEKIKHNDQVAAANNPPPAEQNPTTPTTPGGSPAPASPAPAEEAPQPLSVDDVKAMSSAGIKPDVIVAEIGTSKSNFKASDITAAQAATPPVDPSVIDCMKKSAAS